VRDHVLITIVSVNRAAPREAEPRDVTAAPGTGIAGAHPWNPAVNSAGARRRARQRDNGGFALLVDKLTSSLLERFLNARQSKTTGQMGDRIGSTYRMYEASKVFNNKLYN
jgi:hypothetical protein